MSTPRMPSPARQLVELRCGRRPRDLALGGNPRGRLCAQAPSGPVLGLHDESGVTRETALDEHVPDLRPRRIRHGGFAPRQNPAIEGAGELTGDIKKDRKSVRDALATIKDFDGITGRMTFTQDGDPIKCAVIVRISDKGEFEFYKSVCP